MVFSRAVSRTATGCVLVLSVVPVACSTRAREGAASAPDEGHPVQVEPVRQEALRRAIDIVGTLAAVDEVTVSSEVEGKVSRIAADLGDRVATGQLLVELDREKLQYAVDQQRAALNRALAKYGVEQVSDAPPPLDHTPDVKKAAAELYQAEQSFKRADELQRRQLLPKQQLDDADAALRTKKAAYDSAIQNAKNLRADIDAAEANLRLAERGLRDASIRAPFDAYVQKRQVSQGEYVKVQTPVMTLVRIDPLKLTTEVPEKMAPWVKVGQPIELLVDASERPLEGTVARISPGVNEQTRAFAVEGRVPNPRGLLKPGTFARAHLTTDKTDQVVTVPATALQYRYGVYRLFVVDGGKLVSHEVKLGDRLGDRMEVVSGIDAGAPIAVSDVERLTDGLRVKTAQARDGKPAQDRQGKGTSAATASQERQGD